MLSPVYHPAMKIVGPVRKKLKVKTVFNILGPMLNPARVPYAVVGVYKEDLVGDSTADSRNNTSICIASVIKIPHHNLTLCLCWARIGLPISLCF